MKLRNHIGSILFVIAAIASGAYAVLDRNAASGDGGQPEPRVFPKFESRDLLRIEVDRAGERLILVRARPEDSFHLESPAAVATDPASVGQLVSAIEAATIVRRVTDIDPQGAPRATGLLVFANKVERFVLGAPAPVPDGAAYFERTGAGTVVVGRELAAAILRPFDAYRERALVPVAATDIDRIESRTPSGALVAERLDDHAFRLAGGRRIARDVAERWLSALPDLRAEAFLDDAAASKARFDRSLVITTRDGRTYALKIGDVCPTDSHDVLVVLAEPKTIACMPQAAAAAFEVAPSAVADRHVFALRPDEASELTIDGPDGGALSLARVGGGFRERRPESRELDADESEAATAILRRLFAVEGPIEAAPPNAPAPAIRVAVGRAGSEALERAELVDTASGAFAKRLSDGAWIALSPAARRAFEPPRGGVRAPWLLPRSYAQAFVSKLAVRCGGFTSALVRGDSGFTFESPKGLPADNARALELLELLGRARAHEIVAGVEAEAARGEPCAITVSWTGDAGPVEATIHVLERPTDGGIDVVVRRDAEPEWFAAPEALRSLAVEPLVDRGALALGAEKFVNVEIVRGGARHPLTGESADTMKQALKDLRALRVERVGATDGIAAPIVEVHAQAEGAPPVVYRVGRAKNGSDLLVRRTGLDVTFRLADTAFPAETLATPAR